MSTTLTATFDVTGWDETPYDEPGDGPRLARATVRKTYHGDLAGEGTAEVLMCQRDASDLAAGSGYVASERVDGTLHGRTGTFVIQHGARAGAGTSAQTFGYVVPGSGTGALRGLRGDVTIAVSPDGVHTLTMDYEIA